MIAVGANSVSIPEKIPKKILKKEGDRVTIR